MAEQIIQCPNCKEKFPLSEVLSNQIRESLLDELSEGNEETERELSEKEDQLKKLEINLKKRSDKIDEELETRLESEIEKIKDDQLSKAEKKVSKNIRELKETLKDRENELEEAQNNELKLRKQQQKLEKDQKAFELKIQRKLDSERDKIRKQVVESIAEEHDLREEDLQNTIDSLTKQIKDLEQNAHKGSQQAQGEVLEIKLEDTLKEQFPQDNIKPVPKGKKGADILHEINNGNGKRCGTIIWESKRTKTWKKDWIEKLKADQRNAKADIAVIMTKAFPKGVNNISLIDGVWVTDYKSAVGLANALRINLVQLYSAKIASTGKNKKMEMVYAYLNGQEFKSRIETLVESFQSLQNDLFKEKAAITAMWSKREKQIAKAFESTVGIYGDMQGIIGLSMPEIDQLEFTPYPKKGNKKLLE